MTGGLLLFVSVHKASQCVIASRSTDQKHLFVQSDARELFYSLFLSSCALCRVINYDYNIISAFLCSHHWSSLVVQTAGYCFFFYFFGPLVLALVEMNTNVSQFETEIKQCRVFDFG